MQNSRIIRKFERFLFKGIPESPEPTWERDGNMNVAMRHTGKAQSNSTEQTNESEVKVIGEFVYDFENQKETYISKI